MANRTETGRCFCGSIAATLDGEPFWICFDHDGDCRKATGAAVVVWVGYRPDQFTIRRGVPRVFSQTPGVERSFCADCGTSIYYKDAGTPNELYLAVGFLDHPEKFHPQAHAYWSEHLPWVQVADNLPKVDRYSRDRDPGIGFPADRLNNRGV